MQTKDEVLGLKGSKTGLLLIHDIGSIDLPTFFGPRLA